MLTPGLLYTVCDDAIKDLTALRDAVTVSLAPRFDAIEQRIVHIDVQYLCAIFHLLACYRKGFFKFIFADQACKFFRTCNIGAFTNIHKVAFRPNR
mgnify:CR=1 FL=1